MSLPTCNQKLKWDSMYLILLHILNKFHVSMIISKGPTYLKYCIWRENETIIFLFATVILSEANLSVCKLLHQFYSRFFDFRLKKGSNCMKYFRKPPTFLYFNRYLDSNVRLIAFCFKIWWSAIPDRLFCRSYTCFIIIENDQ